MTLLDASAAPPPQALRLDRHLTGDDARSALERDVRAGLTAEPKSLPPKWFYDAQGSVLFDEITRLPEYYPTRAEKAVLSARAQEIAAVTAADTLVELGSGTSEKTRLLLDALRDAGTLQRFVPFDVDPSVLSRPARPSPATTRTSRCTPWRATSSGTSRCCRGAAAGWWPSSAARSATSCRTSGRCSCATSPPASDATTPCCSAPTSSRTRTGWCGPTTTAPARPAAFNRNVLHVLRRELGADVDPDAFDHVAVWDAENEWIEMRLRSVRDQVVRVLDLEIRFTRGEELRTEISAKFRRERVEGELAHAGLRMVRWWTDPAGDYAVSLSVPAEVRT
jgi:L-histidine N-alpha-methyltransferase